jgi:hypothetical protein
MQGRCRQRGRSSELKVHPHPVPPTLSQPMERPPPGACWGLGRARPASLSSTPHRAGGEEDGAPQQTRLPWVGLLSAMLLRKAALGAWRIVKASVATRPRLPAVSEDHISVAGFIHSPPLKRPLSVFTCMALHACRVVHTL